MFVIVYGFPLFEFTLELLISLLYFLTKFGNRETKSIDKHCCESCLLLVKSLNFVLCSPTMVAYVGHAFTLDALASNILI